MLYVGNLKIEEVDIMGGIFQRDGLSPLLFAIGLTPLRLILGKINAAYEFSRSKEMINHLLFKDNLRLFSKSEKKADPLVQKVCAFIKDAGMVFGIGNCTMLVLKKSKIIKPVGTERLDDVTEPITRR